MTVIHQIWQVVTFPHFLESLLNTSSSDVGTGHEYIEYTGTR